MMRYVFRHIFFARGVLKSAICDPRHHLFPTFHERFRRGENIIYNTTALLATQGKKQWPL